MRTLLMKPIILFLFILCVIFQSCGSGGDDEDIIKASYPPDTSQETLVLLGNWHFYYTIISTFSDYYSLTTVSTEKNSEGEYFVFGTDEYGDTVVAAFYPDTIKGWTLLNQSNIIDLFYVFYTDGNKILPNSCYYQIDKSTGQWSKCYTLNGSKITQAAFNMLTQSNNDENDGKIIETQKLNEIDEISNPDFEIFKKYNEIKNR